MTPADIMVAMPSWNSGQVAVVVGRVGIEPDTSPPPPLAPPLPPAPPVPVGSVPPLPSSPPHPVSVERAQRMVACAANRAKNIFGRYLFVEPSSRIGRKAIALAAHWRRRRYKTPT